MTKRLLRDYRQLCAHEGFALQEIKTTGKHFRLCFENGFVIAPSTPSSHRNMLNVRGEIRRLHR